MLIEFKFKNFRSFRDEQVLSLVAGNGREHQPNLFDTGRIKLLKTAAVYGANASGKSSLLEAMSFMSSLVLGSADLEGHDMIRFEPFELEPSAARKSIQFEVSFLIDGVRYQFGFEYTAQHIKSEWLLAFPKGRAQRWYERTTLSAAEDSDWYFGPSLKGENEKLREFTKSKSLFLSVAAKFNHKQLTPVFNWFNRGLGFWLPKDPLERAISYTATRCHEEAAFKSKLAGLLRDADFGISRFEVEEEEVSEKEAKKRLGERLTASEPRESGTVKLWRAIFFHGEATGQQSEGFGLEKESRGTQRMFGLAGPFLDSLEKGAVLVVDELEASLHPLLSRKLVELFQSEEINKHNAQLIFATHDVTLLDPDLLRRDQIWLTEKAGDGATHLYPLLEYKPRKGEALQKGYLAGRYGALPVFGDFELR